MNIFFFFKSIYLKPYLFLYTRAKKWNSTIANTPQDPPPGLVDVLKAEVNSLRIRAAEMERECKN